MCVACVKIVDEMVALGVPYDEAVDMLWEFSAFPVGGVSAEARADLLKWAREYGKKVV